MVHSVDEHGDGSSAKTLKKERRESQLAFEREVEMGDEIAKLTEIKVLAAMAEEAHSGKASTM